MISRAQLIVENLELVLDLRVVAARAWVLLLLSGDVVHDVPLGGRDEGVRHVLVAVAEAGPH